MLANMGNISKLMDQMIAGPTDLDRLEVHAPASALARIRAATQRTLQDPHFWEFDNDFQTGYLQKIDQSDEQEKVQRLIHSVWCHVVVH